MLQKIYQSCSKNWSDIGLISVELERKVIELLGMFIVFIYNPQ